VSSTYITNFYVNRKRDQDCFIWSLFYLWAICTYRYVCANCTTLLVGQHTGQAINFYLSEKNNPFQPGPRYEHNRSTIHLKAIYIRSCPAFR